MIPRLRFPTAPLVGLLVSGLILTARAAPPAGPDVREFLVPRQNLAEALKATPKAVLLTADQVAVLLRDARPEPLKPVLPPPVPAVLQKAHYHGVPGDRFVTLRGEFEVECLTDTWTEVPLELHPRWLGRVEVDGASAVQTADGKEAAATAVKLLVQGKGRHALTIDFAVPVVDEAGRRHLEMTAPGAAEATLILTLPDKVKLESAEPFVQRGGEAVVALPVERRAFRLSWSRQDLAPLENAAVFQTFRTRYTLDPVRLEADLALEWQSPLRPLPGQLVLPLPPDATVMAVEGPELRQWTLAGDRLVVDFLPGVRQDASLRLVLERGLTLAEAGKPQQLPLPAPAAEGVPRASGQFSIFTTGDLRVRSVNAGPLAERDDSRTPPAGDRRASGTWVFPVLPTDPVVEIQALRVQFAALLDTQISLTREAVRLKRWLTLTPRDGTLFSPKLEGLAAGEDIESVTTPDGSPVTWRKTERGVVFPDNKGIAAGSPWTVVVSSRLDPAGWQAMTEVSQGLSLGSAAVPGAGKVNGYVALDFEDALFVRTTTATGLEPRDPRQFAGVLPLTGRMAWSRLEDFRLDLAVSRRAPEFDAAVVLYALPLLNSLEVEGALTLTIDRSPLREARVLFPPEVAAAVRWDSPLLAESSLEPDNSWRLRFHQETEGAPVLRFRLSVPQTDATEEVPGVPGGMGPERRFKVAVPLPAVPGARRLQGAVVVEANTDTELTPQATGMNSVDTLKAPALDGYRPRHRLVSAWAWLGGNPSLTVSGVRHRPGDLVATVVDRLTLDTVVSQDGPVRHQARMEVRTAGGQYLDVILPEPARVLTLLVNEAAVKPVRNRQGGLRVPLPANLAVVRLICECPGEAMSAAAQRKLVPITLDPALPVLETTWQLHLPDGFTYSGFDSNLTPVSSAEDQPVPSVVGLAMAEWNPFSGLIMSGRKAESPEFLPGGGGGGGGNEQKITPKQWEANQDARVARIAAALDNKLKTQEAEVEASRTEMMQLMKQYGIVDMSIMSGRGLSPTLGTSDDSYRDSKRSELEMQTQVATLKANLEILQKAEGEQLIESALSLGIKDAMLEDLATKYKADWAEYEWMTNSGMRASHPEVAALREQIEKEKSVLLTAFENYRASLGITIKNLEEALAGVREIRDEKKTESVEEKQRSAEYSQSKSRYEMKLDLLNQMRETFLKTQVSELQPRMQYGGEASKGAIFGDEENSFDNPRAGVIAAPEPVASPASMSSGMETRMFKVPQNFLSKGAASQSSGLAGRPDAKTVLTQLGLEFPEGATAIYEAGTGTIVVRNTAEQLANVDAVLSMMGQGPSAAADGAKAGDSDREGILPLDFALPEGGRVYAFAGQYAPGAVEFRYQSWERRMQWSWFWMIAGAGLFWILTRRSPWFMGLLGLLLLQFLPVVLGRPEWLPAANALVIGWLAGAALRVVGWVLRRGKAPRARLASAGHLAVLVIFALASQATEARAGEVTGNWSVKTTVSRSGLIRHEVSGKVSGAGGRMQVRLPHGAVLQWLAVDGGLRKPEWGTEGELNIQTPPTPANLRLMVDVQQTPLDGSGWLPLDPVGLEALSPSGNSVWEICLPEGFVPGGLTADQKMKPAGAWRERVLSSYADLNLFGGKSRSRLGGENQKIPSMADPIAEMKAEANRLEVEVGVHWTAMMDIVRNGPLHERVDMFFFGGRDQLCGKYREYDQHSSESLVEFRRGREELAGELANLRGQSVENRLEENARRKNSHSPPKLLYVDFFRRLNLDRELQEAGGDPSRPEVAELRFLVEQDRQVMAPLAARDEEKLQSFLKLYDDALDEGKRIPRRQSGVDPATREKMGSDYAVALQKYKVDDAKLYLLHAKWVAAERFKALVPDHSDWDAMTRLEKRIFDLEQEAAMAEQQMMEAGNTYFDAQIPIDMRKLDRLAFAFQEDDFLAASPTEQHQVLSFMKAAYEELRPLSGQYLLRQADRYPFADRIPTANVTDYQELLSESYRLALAGPALHSKQLNALHLTIDAKRRELIEIAEQSRSRLASDLEKARGIMERSIPSAVELLDEAADQQRAADYRHASVRYRAKQEILTQLKDFRTIAASDHGVEYADWMLVRQETPPGAHSKLVVVSPPASSTGIGLRYETAERRMMWSWLLIAVGGGVFQIVVRRKFWIVTLAGLALIQMAPLVLGRSEWLPTANALVIGWLAGAALRVVRWALRRKQAAVPVLANNGPVVALLVALLVFAGGKAQANEAVAKPAPEAPVVVVPYDPDKPEEASSQRYLSYETFERLWAAAKENRARQAAAPGLAAAGGERGATLTSAWHRAVVEGAVLRVEAVFALQTRGPDWVSVPFGLSNGLRSLTLDGAAAALKDGQLLVEKAGAHTVSAAYDVPLPAGWQEVSWPVPAATATSLALSLAMEDPARPVVNGGAPLAEEEAAGRRVFTATLGNTAVISLKRRTTADRAGAAAAVPPLAKVRTRVYITPALERVESAVAFTFAGQERRAFSLRMEAGLVPVSFLVPGLENWSLRRDGGMQVLDLNLERAVPDEFSLSLVAERPVAGLPLTENAPQVSAAADRVELEWSVLATDDLEVKPQAGAGLQRAEFVRGPGTDDEGFDRVGTWQAAGVAEALRWELRARVPEAAAVVRYALQPGAGKLELSAGMELRPAPGRELRELTIRVPAGSTIQGVTGERLEDWWHEDTALHVRFSGGGAAVIPLALNLTQPLAEGAAEVTFQPLGIEGFAKVSGSGLLIAPLNQEAVLRLAPGKAVLREVAPQEAGTGFTIRRPFEEKRGFVFEGSGWTATARLAPLVERYDVDWVMEAEVRDSWVALNARVLVGLTRGGVERIAFATPASAPEFRVTGDDVRETVSVVEGNVRRYTVSFQTLMTGAVLFTLTGQLPHTGTAGLPDLEFAGAARTSRFVILNNKSDGELKVEASGVEVTPREQVSFLPEELASGRGGAQFYAARAGWSMKLGVEKLETTAGQAALILQADLTTSLLRNGDVWQRAVYVVQNRSLQFLPVHLPAEAEVISVSVGGVTTRADRGVVDGLTVLLVPLIQTNAGELASEVSLIYRRRGAAGVFPQGLEDPDLPGLSVGQTFWTVQYPDGYVLKPDGGNMTATDDSALVTEKALSRLSELVSLRSIANSDKYDEETRTLSRRNAQKIAATFQSALENGKDGRDQTDGEISKLVKEVQADVVPVPEANKPVDGVKADAQMKAKKFSHNNLTEGQVQLLNQSQVGAKASDLNLNDNVAWSSTKGKKPEEAGLAVKEKAINEPVINNRLSQIRRFERGGSNAEAKPDMKPGAGEAKGQGKGQGAAAGAKDRSPDESGARQQADFSKQNNEFSFGNNRLNGGFQPPQGLELQKQAEAGQAMQPAKPQSLTVSGAVMATPPAPAPGQSAPADPFAAPEKRDDTLALDGGSSLRSSGRNSLEGVFPEQRNALHFRKVKGDAVLGLQLEKPWSAQVDPGAAGMLGGWIGVLLLGRWGWGRWSRRKVGRLA